MSKYGISVREILKRTVIVEAENIEEAIQKVEEAVERDEIILNVDDYDDREIMPSEYFEGGKNYSSFFLPIHQELYFFLL